MATISAVCEVLMRKLTATITVTFDNDAAEHYAADHFLAWWDGSINSAAFTEHLANRIAGTINQSTLGEYAKTALTHAHLDNE